MPIHEHGAGPIGTTCRGCIHSVSTTMDGKPIAYCAFNRLPVIPDDRSCASYTEVDPIVAAMRELAAVFVRAPK